MLSMKNYTTTLNQMYPTQSASTYTHTHIYLLRRFLVKGAWFDANDPDLTN